jgi:hypothetical protein
MATDGSTFRVVDWMRDVQEEHEDVEIIKRNVNLGKVEYECPNVELHTGGRRERSSPAYALQSVDGWHMGCMTDGCGDLYQDDRLPALDDFIQNTLPDGPLVKDAIELVRWCDEPESHDERTMDELIAELQPEDTIVSDRVQSVVKAIAKLPEWQHGQHARTVKDRTNCQKGDVDKAIKAAVKEAKASEKAKQKEIPTPDSLDLTTDHLRVYAAWGKDKLIETMTNFIVQRQQSDPTVFRRYDNAIAEIVPTDPPTLREMDRTHMKAYANHCVTAITIDKDRNESDDFIDGRVVDTVWNEL